MSVCEAHSIWKSEHPERRKIGKSKFAKLRPEHILLTSELPRNVCMCKVHENFIQLLKALHKHDNFFPIHSNNFPSNFVCDEDDCWFNKCLLSQNGQLFVKKFTFREDVTAIGTENELCSWWEWKKMKLLKTGKDILDRVKVAANAKDLHAAVVSSMPKFLQFYESPFYKKTTSKSIQQLQGFFER